MMYNCKLLLRGDFSHKVICTTQSLGTSVVSLFIAATGSAVAGLDLCVIEGSGVVERVAMAVGALRTSIVRTLQVHMEVTDFSRVATFAVLIDYRKVQDVGFRVGLLM